MRKNHTNIPWGPIITHETYEGYVAFCKRQKERLEAMDPQRRVKIHQHGPITVHVHVRDSGANAILEIKDANN